MAGDVKFANKSAALSTAAGGTTDFIKAGFGAVLACHVLISFDAVDDSGVAAEGKVSIGFSNFTDDFCITHQDEDASAKVDSDSRKSPTKAYVILGTNGAVLFSGTISAITDGVRLTHTAGEAPASAFFASVLLIGGADPAVDLRSTLIASAQNGTANITHAGLTDGNEKLIFFIGVDIAGEDSSSTGVNNSSGVCHVSGNDAGGYTFTQRCVGWASDHNNANGSPSAVLRNDRVLSMITETGGQDWGLEVTAFSSAGGTITVTTRDAGAGAGMEVYSFIVDLDNRKGKVFSVDSPISGATWVVTGMGFKPQVVGLGLTHLTAENTIDSGADSGALGISFNTGSGEETCHSFYNEDAEPTIDTANLFRSRVIDFRDDGTDTVIQDHSHLSFDSDGFTTTINTENETTARKFSGWAVEEIVLIFDPDADAFRFYDDGTESGSSPKAAEDTDIILDPTGDAQFHLRYRVQNDGSLDGATTDDFALEVSKNSGAFVAVTGASSDVQSDTASGLVADAVTTNRVTDGITDGLGSFVAGEQEETNGVIEDRQLTADNFTEHVWACKLIDADLAGGDTLDFRVTLNGAAPGMTNSVTPRITTPSAGWGPRLGGERNRRVVH